MDLTAELVAECGPEELFSWVADLSTSPRWLGIVERAERLEAETPSWTVDLAARVGPFSRSKRLRMERIEHAAPVTAVFERREFDGREHGLWRLEALVDGESDRSRLRMRLHYGGRLWGPVLEPILSEEIERSKARLSGLVAGSAQP
jgi:hypothetical protein